MKKNKVQMNEKMKIYVCYCSKVFIGCIEEKSTGDYVFVVLVHSYSYSANTAIMVTGTFLPSLLVLNHSVWQLEVWPILASRVDRVNLQRQDNVWASALIRVSIRYNFFRV